LFIVSLDYKQLNLKLMKKIHLLFLAPLLMVACQTKPVANAASTSADSTIKLPYSLKKESAWQMNPDKHNLQTALNAIKAFETNDTTAMKGLIADSIHVYYEGGEFNGKRADFLKAVKQEMDMYKDMHVDMDDWESVINKDKSEEWVSTWYKQKWQNNKGKTDSLQVFNDMKLKGGKLVRWVDYARHYAPKK
jgi:hypothetical protein